MKCDVCRVEIVGTYYYHPLFKDYACHSCAFTDVCRWCGRYRPTELHHGFESCRNCISTSVKDESDIEKLKKRVMPIVNLHIGPNNYEKLPVRFGESMTASAEYGDSVGVIQGQAIYGGSGSHIRLLRGMPFGTAIGTLCHEYGHMAVNLDPVTLEIREDHSSLPLIIEEGFCEVMCATALLTDSSDSARWVSFLMPGNPNPIYGDGFRQMWPRAIELGSIGALLDELIEDNHSYRGPAVDKVTEDFEIPEDIAPFVDADTGDRDRGPLRGRAILVQDLPEDAPVGPRLRGRGIAVLDKPKTPKPPTVITGVLRGSGLTDISAEKEPPAPGKLRGTEILKSGSEKSEVARGTLRGAGLNSPAPKESGPRRGILRGRGVRRKK